MQALLTLLFVVVFNFFLFRVLPGDPVAFLTRGARARRLSVEEQAELRAEFGLDKPSFPGQFVDYMGDTLTARLRRLVDLRPGQSVVDGVLRGSCGRRCLLVGVSTVFSAIIGIVLGI